MKFENDVDQKQVLAVSLEKPLFDSESHSNLVKWNNISR